jgi:ketosteroid isomerase-like protein
MAQASTSPENLVARIQRLEDIEAIKQLKARYARACDPAHNVDFLMSLFTEDAVFDVGEKYGSHEGKTAIRKFLEGADAIMPWAFHCMLSPVIEIAVDGQTAKGSWYLFELSTMPHLKTGAPQSIWIAGVYEDEFVKRGGEWKIRRITLRMHIMSPYEDGWAKTPWRGET